MRNWRGTTRWARTGAWALTMLMAWSVGAMAAEPQARNLFAQFDLPDAWESRFWRDPAVEALLALEPKAIADMVPIQAGVRYCRCPACDATEAEDPLGWSVAKPTILTCRRCGIAVPNDKFPAPDKDKKIPEEAVEVLPRIIHKYPYHAVEPEKQRYPDERLYLAAKRDYEVRQFLTKAAFYAAVRYHKAPAGKKDPKLARFASAVILRFAQVYPAYATHFDQPENPKVFQQADLTPPYRRGYKTGKWDWTASLNVPLNLVIAYALLRDDPALVEAAKALDDPHPRKTIERDFFRASAEFVKIQPEEYSEMSLQAYRGLLAVGRLLDDPTLVHEALGRLDGFAERGFYHDGLWRQGDVSAHRRVMSLIDGWIDRLLAGYSDPPDYREREREPRLDKIAGVSQIPVLMLARNAGSLALSEPPTPEIQQAAWPVVARPANPRHPALLGGAGLARLAVGEGPGALDLEVRGQDNFGGLHFQRLAFRLSVAGKSVMGDLDELAATPTGWERSTASHNTVVVDGLNQRESLAKASIPALGSNFLYFAADPDFQVASLDDPRAYPLSTTRYRHTMIASSNENANYAVGVFEVHGGLQHDQIFHGSAGSTARWEVGVPTFAGPSSLLPSTIPFVPNARAEDGRWFVQAYGEFTPLAQARFKKPTTASLRRPDGSGLRLHILGDMPAAVVTATSPDPTIEVNTKAGEEPGRGSLILRRRSGNGSTLKTTFITVFEPTLGENKGLLRVGRVGSPEGTIVLYVETSAGPENIVINLQPGTEVDVALADGNRVRTDGLAVRIVGQEVVLAGGTFAETGGQRVVQSEAEGRITGTMRHTSEEERGWFTTDVSLPDPATLVGRTLLVRHGDGTTHGWTLRAVENTSEGARLHVLEEPGFEVGRRRDDPAQYYQFPRNSAPGPHKFRISKMSRSIAPRS
ncbi:heparinase II/III domain-containing protein [Singulisphaera sp. PoT]|uniref:heparinase II/III domain-containing protein n=1 Tax=Singulisphaera sp. PoT TaxID=3411797 RepID=UPI003BF49BB3